MEDSFATGYAVGSDSKNGFFGGDGSWIWILLIFLLFGGWGNGGFGGYGGHAPASQADMTAAFDHLTTHDTLNGIENSLANALCDTKAAIQDQSYNQAMLINGLQGNMMQGFNSTNVALLQGFNGVQAGQAAIANQINQLDCNAASRACDLRYQLATDTCALQNSMATNTRDIVDSNNAGTRAILEAINVMKTEALQDKINALTSENQTLKFSVSQQAQNALLTNAMNAQTQRLIDNLNPTPIPSYNVPNPNCCNTNYGCGCGV